jgi:hypothetical protein
MAKVKTPHKCHIGQERVKEFPPNSLVLKILTKIPNTNQLVPVYGISIPILAKLPVSKR